MIMPNINYRALLPFFGAPIRPLMLPPPALLAQPAEWGKHERTGKLAAQIFADAAVALIAKGTIAPDTAAGEGSPDATAPMWSSLAAKSLDAATAFHAELAARQPEGYRL